MDYMKGCEDNAFDLAIVDPPYGINRDGNTTVKGKGRKANTFQDKQHHEKKGWDKSIPEKHYFDELMRVSKKQIIWGGNYFTEHLKPVKSWVFWYKKETNPNNKNFSDGELAWVSDNSITRYVSIDWIGFGYINSGEKKIHPTQKPLRLYDWLLTNYAEKGQKILDTHLGSGSSAIAAHYFGCDFTGIEIDEDYFNASIERITEQTKQMDLLA